MADSSIPALEPPRTRSTPKSIAMAIALIAVILAVLITAFALPASRSAAHHIPLGVVSPAAVSQQVDALDEFDVTTYPNENAARDAIADRDVYGAIVIDGSMVTTLTASAASPAVAALVSPLGESISQQIGGTFHIEDVRAFPSDDPKGAGLAAGALPLALGGWIAATVIMLLVSGAGARLIAAAGVAVAGGLVLVSMMEFAIGTFDGNFWATSAAAIFAIFATCLMVLGLREFLGTAGLGIAAVLLILLGNPLSGLSSAPEMLPRPWGAIGQLLPPGATGSLLRNVAFFDGHAIMHPVVVLSCWLAGGLALYLIGVARSRRDHRVDVDEIHFGHRPAPALD